MLRDGCALVVHRPNHGDWAFPTGKLEPGESWEDAALREVEEETGLACELGEYVGSTHYELPEGPKEVRFYLMSAEGEPRAQNEVDEVRWVTLADADELLTYPYDRELLRKVSVTRRT